MKYFIFSIDDGTVFDKEIIDIFHKHNVAATFNLNSGLGDFVWYKEDHPIHRFPLSQIKEIYEGFDIASHSLTHPHLTMCPSEVIHHEVSNDIDNLSKIFKKEIKTFAFPFEDYDERTIEIIKNIENISLIRISKIHPGFAMDFDRYHISITTWKLDEVDGLLDDFIKDDDAQIFIYVFHGYDYGLTNRYEELEQLILKIKANGITIIPFSDLDNLL